MPLGWIVIEKTDHFVRFFGRPQTTENEGSGIACTEDKHPPFLLLSALRPALPRAEQSQSQTHQRHADKETEPINKQDQARKRTNIQEKRHSYKEHATRSNGLQDIPDIRI